MKIGIVGWGVEGQSVYKYFGRYHQYLIASEHWHEDLPQESDSVSVQYLKEDKPTGISGQIQDLSYLNGIENCDQIVYTPTSYKNLQKYIGDKKEVWAKAATAQHIFFQNVKTKNIIGVTGTKGKGTTSTLIHLMLKAAGKNSYLGGNVGTSVLDFLREVEPDDWVVLELSNFQLIDFPYSPHIAVCLMITPEHLDWHPDVNEYIAAKANIFRHQTPQDVAVFLANDPISTQIAATSKGVKVPYFQKPGAWVRPDGMIVVGADEKPVISKTEVKLLGEHNLQNICAALTALQEAAVSLDNAGSVLSSFSGLEHRLELVRSLNNVKYYDDSFGTTPDTAIVAMQAVAEPKVMILGGSDKGIPFDQLADEVTRANVRHVIAIGDTGPIITTLLKQRGYNSVTAGLSTMPDIVSAARMMAQPGDAVLLSTGCASFGLFKDYKDRGNQFKAAVQALA